MSVALVKRNLEIVCLYMTDVYRNIQKNLSLVDLTATSEKLNCNFQVQKVGTK